jgi:hypothetical protein
MLSCQYDYYHDRNAHGDGHHERYLNYYLNFYWGWCKEGSCFGVIYPEYIFGGSVIIIDGNFGTIIRINQLGSLLAQFLHIFVLVYVCDIVSRLFGSFLPLFHRYYL